MMTVATLQKLENAGFDRKQAEALVESFATDLDQLATKADIAAIKADLYRAPCGCSWGASSLSPQDC